MEIQFKTKNDKQLEAAGYWCDDVTEEILYGGAKGGGKSYLGASLIFGDALIYPGTHYFIARQELNDLRKFTMPTVGEVFKNWGLPIEIYAPYNGQDNCYNLHNGSKVFLIACKEIPSDPMFERFGSMQMTRGWLEEAGEIAEAAKANLALSIGRWKNSEYGLMGKLLLTANPKKGWLKRTFVDPFKAGILSIKLRYVQARATDNTYLPAQYVEKLRSEKDQVRRQRLWEGDWDYDDDKNSLVAYDALTDLFSNTALPSKEKYLIVDVARQGKDRTVFAFWRGLELFKLEIRTKQGTDVTEQQARDFAATEAIPFSHVLIDEDGIGGGVVDHLPGVKGFNANSTPIPSDGEIRDRRSRVYEIPSYKGNYANLKAQCGWKLAELINEHKMAVKTTEYRDEIIEEVSATLKDKNPDSDGKLRLIPKDEVKESLGRSPDIGDTLLMRAWFEIQPTIYEQPAIVNTTQNDFFNRNAGDNQVFEAA